jgi:LacI family transcriptional regulator
MGSKGSTLHEVAKRAGVSIATVSRVARGFEQIAPSTRDRVLSAIEELNYRPSHFGKALQKRRHGTLGIVFPGLRGPYYAEVIHGFEVEAIEAELSLLILGTELQKEADRQVLGMADRADGLAIMGGTIDDSLIRNLVRRHVPIVTMARPQLDAIPNIRVDNFTSTLDLTRHLIEGHGYEQIEFVGNIVGAPDALDRWHGFQAAFVGTDLVPPDKPIRVGFDHTSGVLAAKQLLDRSSMPQAVVCGNDEIAFGMLSTLVVHNLRVPEDIAITGWDDNPFSRYTTPPLTTVGQPARVLGQLTAQTLLATIDHRLGQPEDVVLPTTLQIRASCGCAFDQSTVFTAETGQPNTHEEGLLTDAHIHA